MDNTREKLIELICKVQYQGNAVHGYQDKYIQNSEIADHLIANGVTLYNQVSKWISVKDRLPEKDVKVLTFGVYGFSVNYRDRFSGKWRGVNGKSQWITHWMPLPQPPKGE